MSRPLRATSAITPHYSIEYHGGEYADVLLDGAAIAVLNMWDYDRNAPAEWAPRTVRAARNILDGFLRDPDNAIGVRA